jgi:hypothetical protein
MNQATADSFADAFREHREAFGVSIQIDDAQITAIVNEVDMARDLVEGGFAEEGDVDAKVLACDLPKKPMIGRECHYGGRKYRVATVRSREGGQVMHLRLRPARR